MYYVIEKYDEYEDRPGSSKYTRYDVRECKTEQDLQKKFLQGPKHGGTLTAARELETIINFEFKEKKSKPSQIRQYDDFAANYR